MNGHRYCYDRFSCARLALPPAVAPTFFLATWANKQFINELKKLLSICLEGFREKAYDHLTWCGEAFSGVKLPLFDLRRKGFALSFFGDRSRQ